MIRMVVDLPAPLGPRKPVTRPRPTVKDTSSTAVYPPYLLVTLSTVIMPPVWWTSARPRTILGHRLAADSPLRR